MMGYEMNQETRDFCWRHRKGIISGAIFTVLLIVSIIMTIVGTNNHNNTIQGIGLGMLFYNMIYGMILITCFHCCPEKCRDSEYEVVD